MSDLSPDEKVQFDKSIQWAIGVIESIPGGTPTEKQAHVTALAAISMAALAREQRAKLADGRSIRGEYRYATLDPKEGE